MALRPADGSDDAKKQAILAETEVILAAGRAGVMVLSTDQLARAKALRVAVDVNAVPPTGLEGVDPMADGSAVEGTEGVGVGALAVGNVKFKTEHELLGKMRDAGTRLVIGVEEALAAARVHAAG